MKLPSEVKAIRGRYVAKFQLWSMPPGPEAENRARSWSVAFAEQVVFERGLGEGWGVKRADAGRPISKDTIARQVGDTLLVWDLLTGAGTGSPTLTPDPDSQEITGQVFVRVEPFDRIGGGVVVPETPKPNGCNACAKVDALRLEMQQQFAHLENLIKQLEDANERRYKNLVAHLNQLAAMIAGVSAKAYQGSLRLPFVGTVSIELTPKP